MDDLPNVARRLLRDLEKSGDIELDDLAACTDEVAGVLAEMLAFASASGRLDLSAAATKVAKTLLHSDAVGEVFADDPELVSRITATLNGEFAAPIEQPALVAPGPANLDELNDAFAPREIATETFEQALARARDWSAGVRRLVSETRLREVLPHVAEGGRASLAEATPIDRPGELIDQLASEAKCELPESIADFIRSVGHVDLFGACHEPVGFSVAGNQSLAKELAWWGSRHPGKARVTDRPGEFEGRIELVISAAIRVGALEDEHPLFAHLAERDDRGESPVYLCYHDEPELYWQAASFPEHFSRVISRVVRAAAEQLAEW